MEELFKRMVQAVSERVMFELNELKGLVILFWRKSEPDIVSSRCRCPEARLSLGFPENSKEDNKAGV